MQRVFAIVLSCRDHAAQKERMRSAWMARLPPPPADVEYAFFDGGGTAAEELHGDVVALAVDDDYSRLSAKTIAAFRWTLRWKPRHGILLKMDDDTHVCPARLLPWLRKATLESGRRLYAGRIVRAPVMRSRFVSTWPKHLKGWRHRFRDADVLKWSVNDSVYASQWYPPYALGGGYVVSRDLAECMHDAWSARRAPVIANIEDATVGMAARLCNATPLREHRLFREGRRSSCCSTAVHHRAPLAQCDACCARPQPSPHLTRMRLTSPTTSITSRRPSAETSAEHRS